MPQIRDRLHRGRLAARRTLAAITPGPRAWRGAAIGISVAVTVLLALAGLALASRRGAAVDVLTAIIFGWLAIAVIAGVLLLLGLLLRWIPPPLRALGLASVLVIAILFALSAGPWALGVAAALLAASALAGAGAFSLVRQQPQRRVHRAMAGGGLVIGVGALLAAGAWLADGGAAPAERGIEPPTGPFGVRTLTYGTGDHPWRDEYGVAVDVPSRTVDGRALLQNWDGWRGGMRTDFWGFGPDALPLNATVRYPDAEGPFPLVLIVHGNARMELPSDAGYGWLADELASRGHVVASIDHNFLNLSLTRGLDMGGENDARAWLLLEHLRLWRDWQDDPASPLHGIADLERIALVGHSRGGEAVATAAYFNQLQRYPEDASLVFEAGFDIRAVVALAPIDGQYEPAGRPTPLTDVSYLAIHGGLDGDVFSFTGLRQYQRTRFSGDEFGVRAAVYLPDANHGQFNTEWGRFDAPGPSGMLLDTDAIMAPADQRAAGSTAIVAFLEATLDGDVDALAPLLDDRHPGWPQGSRPILRYADSSEITIAGFDEDADPATGTLPGATLESHGLAAWREQPAPLRLGEQGSNVAVIGWSHGQGRPPSLSIRLPEGWRSPPNPILTLSIADSGQPPPGTASPATQPLDASIELVDAHGATLRRALADLGGIPTAQQSRRLKPPLPEWATSIEPVARTFRIPLSEDAGFDAAALREIRLIFDLTPAGLIHLDHVGIASGTPVAGH